jgi:hypothetical protein
LQLALTDISQPFNRAVHLVVVPAPSPTGNQATYFAPDESADFAADIGLPGDPGYDRAASMLLDSPLEPISVGVSDGVSKWWFQTPSLGVWDGYDRASCAR